MDKASDNESMMSFKSTPFYIVLFSSALPWVAAAANSKMLTYIPDALAAVAYLLFATRYPGRAIRIHPYFVTVLLLVVFHMTFNMLSGRSIGSAGLVSLFILTFVFSKLLDQGKTEHWAGTITDQISLIYIIHVVFVSIEILIRLAGHTDILVAIAGNATEVTKYKIYNSAAFLNFLGFDDISGMNGMLLGSQSASMLVLFAFFWFAPVYKGRSLARGTLPPKFWFIISAVLFPFVASMTATALLALLTLFTVYVLPNSVLNRRSIWIAAPLLVAAFNDVLFSLVTFRIREAADVDIYTTAFLDAPLKFLALPLLDQIMGYGRNIAESGIEAADFGLAMITYQAGLYLVGLALMSFTLMIYAVLRAIRRERKTGYPSNRWVTLVSINIVCAIGWAASLIHYTPAIELGGRHLFAMHLAVCLVSLKRMAEIQRSERYISLPANGPSELPASSR